MKTIKGSKCYTSAEVAKLLQVEITTVQKYTRQRGLQFVEENKRKFFTEQHLLEFLENWAASREKGAPKKR